MPCYQPSAEYQSGHKDGVRQNAAHHPDDAIEIRRLNNLVGRLNGALCAVISELEDWEIVEQILVNASRNGLIDLVSFWKEHKKDDRSKLLAKIHKYSIHEQRIIKDLLKDI